MKYTPFDSKQFSSYMNTYHTNSLVAKTMDYMQLDDETIRNLNKMIFHDYSLFLESDLAGNIL